MRTNGTLPQRQLGRKLRELREDAGLTLEEAAPQLDWSTSKLNRIENGQQSVDVHGVRSMLDLYDVGGDRWTEIIDLTRAARQKGWWHAYGIKGRGFVALEADAAVMHVYHLGLVPGLLQTPDYARAVFRGSSVPRTEAEIERVVQVRLRRQCRLTEDPPLQLVAIMDETVLRRPIGGVEVMRGQLRHLVRQAELPSVCVQVMPLSSWAHQGLCGSFVVLEFTDSDEPAIVYLEDAVNTMNVHKEAEVRGYQLAFDRLRSAALSPDDSVALVERLADDF